MGMTKRKAIELAFEELGYFDYEFDLDPEQWQSALSILDSMAMEWNSKGIRIGYTVPSTPGGGSLDDETGVPDKAWEAIRTNLAVKVAPGVGKKISSETRTAARSSYLTLLSTSHIPGQRKMPPGFPIGSGNKTQYTDSSVFTQEPSDTLDAGSDSSITLE